ncbi:MAG TPA: hypothetical protein VFB67_06335 [Candidatus Polarisedimenticolaceae bacterium]|nr:hypothetical protein [Candidatus Polarisedimenticolaceae bacterium]
MAERIPLTKAVELLLEECRMVLPGIQALFGFQLIAVFSDAFFDRLSAGERQRGTRPRQRVHREAPPRRNAGAYSRPHGGISDTGASPHPHRR